MDRLPAALAGGQIFAQRFQLIRKLGEGGMGQVWLADQTSPVRRQVALKLIKAGMYDEALVHASRRSGNRWRSWIIRRSPRCLTPGPRRKASHIL